MRSFIRPSHCGTVAALATGLIAAGAAQGAYITDPGFFNDYPSTLITFETDGMGNTISLIEGQSQAMPANEYASLGVTFTGGSGPVYWVNDGNTAFDVAQSLGGSANIAIPSSLTNSFTITFTTEVRAFGFFVVNNRNVDPTGPVFVVRDTEGNIIDTAEFGPTFVAGTIPTPNTTADYGFMGVMTTVPIGSVTITKQAAILDDLHFSAVPTPGSMLVAGIGPVLLIRRRR